MGTLLKGDIGNASPKVQAWQQQVAWRWRRAAKRARLNPKLQRFGEGAVVPISRILLVGGATRMPAIGTSAAYAGSGEVAFEISAEPRTPRAPFRQVASCGGRRGSSPRRASTLSRRWPLAPRSKPL